MKNKIISSSGAFANHYQKPDMAHGKSNLHQYKKQTRQSEIFNQTLLQGRSARWVSRHPVKSDDPAPTFQKQLWSVIFSCLVFSNEMIPIATQALLAKKPIKNLDKKKSVEQDPYQILHISSNANETTLRHAYHECAKREHPDVGGNAKKFIQCVNAYEILSSRGIHSHSSVQKENKQRLSLLGPSNLLLQNTTSEVIEKPSLISLERPPLIVATFLDQSSLPSIEMAFQRNVSESVSIADIPQKRQGFFESAKSMHQITLQSQLPSQMSNLVNQITNVLVSLTFGPVALLSYPKFANAMFQGPGYYYNPGFIGPAFVNAYLQDAQNYVNNKNIMEYNEEVLKYNNDVSGNENIVLDYLKETLEKIKDYKSLPMDDEQKDILIEALKYSQELKTHFQQPQLKFRQDFQYMSGVVSNDERKQFNRDVEKYNNDMINSHNYKINEFHLFINNFKILISEYLKEFKKKKSLQDKNDLMHKINKIEGFVGGKYYDINEAFQKASETLLTPEDKYFEIPIGKRAMAGSKIKEIEKLIPSPSMMKEKRTGIYLTSKDLLPLFKTHDNSFLVANSLLEAFTHAKYLPDIPFIARKLLLSLEKGTLTAERLSENLANFFSTFKTVEDYFTLTAQLDHKGTGFISTISPLLTQHMLTSGSKLICSQKECGIINSLASEVDDGKRSMQSAQNWLSTHAYPIQNAQALLRIIQPYDKEFLGSVFVGDGPVDPHVRALQGSSDLAIQIMKLIAGNQPLKNRYDPNVGETVQKITLKDKTSIVFNAKSQSIIVSNIPKWIFKESITLKFISKSNPSFWTKEEEKIIQLIKNLQQKFFRKNTQKSS